MSLMLEVGYRISLLVTRIIDFISPTKRINILMDAKRDIKNKSFSLIWIVEVVEAKSKFAQDFFTAIAGII